MTENGRQEMKKMSLLTGCNDKHYQLGLLSGLVANGVEVDFIANDEMREAENFENTHYFNFRQDQDPRAGVKDKMLRVLKYYGRLIKYTATTDSRLFHIQWLNKFVYFDRTLLNLYYKMFGKTLVYTAHNIDETQRDGGGSLMNRWTLKFMYGITDHIIVHTSLMKQQLVDIFKVNKDKISVIPHGIHNAIPETGLTCRQAREKLLLHPEDKVIVFFGNIVPYKGLEYLLLALKELKTKYENIKLIMAGRIHKVPAYRDKIFAIIEEHSLQDCIIQKTEFIPDEEIEVLFKSADISALPYVYIFQSGILFVSYNFGLPVVATDVGSLREEILEGKTGFVCRPEDSEDLARKIEAYFESDIYRNLDQNRPKIKEYANDKYSWEKIGEKTEHVYAKFLA